jgi:hypothetical protein
MIKDDDLGWACNMHGKDYKFTIFTGKTEEKKPRYQ